MRLVFNWDVSKCLKADTLGYLLFRHRKMFDYMFSKYLQDRVVNVCCYLSDNGNCLRFGANCSSDVFRPVYINACFIHVFLSVVQMQSQNSMLSIADGWKTL